MKRTAFAILATLIFASFSFADIPRPEVKPTPKPKPEKAIDTTLMIRLDADAKEAKLMIPRSQLKSLRSALDQMDGPNDTTAAAITSGGLTRTQTVFSGVFMSLAIVFGGIWFARSRKLESRGVKAAVITLGIAAIASAATFVYANAGPPAEARSITGKMFTQAVHMYGFGSGRIKLVVSDEDSPYLIVPNPKDGNGEE